MANIFEDVRNRVSLEDAISFLSLKLTKREGDQLRFECPHCKGANKRALSINLDKGFTCFSANKRGNDATALVAHCRNVSQRDAAQTLCDHFRLSEAQPRASQAQLSGSEVQLASHMQPLDYLETDHEIVELLGLTPRSLELIGGGYAPKGTMAGRLLIPLRLPTGVLAGYLGIATREDQEPLLLFPKNLEARVAPAGDKPPADELRKMFRVVG
jgi:hypothetical protein